MVSSLLYFLFLLFVGCLVVLCFVVGMACLLSFVLFLMALPFAKIKFKKGKKKTKKGKKKQNQMKELNL